MQTARSQAAALDAWFSVLLVLLSMQLSVDASYLRHNHVAF
jgi:hypothetical protein